MAAPIPDELFQHAESLRNALDRDVEDELVRRVDRTLTHHLTDAAREEEEREISMRREANRRLLRHWDS